MGISNFIREKKKYGMMKPKEYIELLRPFLNVFVGEFHNMERECLMQFLNERIGNSNKVNYCQILLGSKKGKDEEGIYGLHIADVDYPSEISLPSRNSIQDQIEVSEQLEKSIKDFVIHIFNTVATNSYISRARIRVNIILQADWQGASITAKLIQCMNTFFSEYFTNGVELDIYCMLDQKGYRAEEKGEEKKCFNYMTLNELEKIAKDSLASMIYIMSNYTSHDCLEPNSTGEIMRTIGLAMLMKDGVSAKGNGNDKDSYNDTAFKEEASSYEGSFYSLGNLNLAVDIDMIEYIVYKAIIDDMHQSIVNADAVKSILSDMNIERDDLERQCAALIKGSMYREEVFYSLVKSQNINAASFLNDSAGKMLHMIYGRTLEYFWNINISGNNERKKELIDDKIKNINKIIREAYINGECSLAEAYSIITTVQSYFEQYTEDYNKKYGDSIKDYKDWSEVPIKVNGLKDIVNETGELRVVYTLTRQYMDKMLHIEEAKNLYEVVSECGRQIQESVNYYRKQLDTLKQASSELDEIIKEMEEEQDELIRGNMRNYYKQFTEQFIDRNMVYKDFKHRLSTRICAKEAEGDVIYGDIIHYCDEYILKKENFKDELSIEMIRRLKNDSRYRSEDAIYDMAFETIMSQRKYYANHVGVGGVFNAVGFLVNPNNNFVNSTNNKMKSLLINHQLKLFFEEHFNGMDILFMEGCFSKESIHNFRLYKTAYEGLSSSKNDMDQAEKMS